MVGCVFFSPPLKAWPCLLHKKLLKNYFHSNKVPIVVAFVVFLKDITLGRRLFKNFSLNLPKFAAFDCKLQLLDDLSCDFK